MSKNSHGKATFIPVTSNKTDQESQRNQAISPSTMVESLFRQNLGWIHTPPFTSVPLDCPKLRVPWSKQRTAFAAEPSKKKFQPKVQVGNILNG